MSDNKVDMKKFLVPGKVKVIKGSIVNPENSGLCFVLNLASLNGSTDSEMYKVFNKKWVKVKQEVRGWYNTRTGAYKLGALHNLAVQSNVWVLSLLCQDDKLNVDLSALRKSLKEVCRLAKYEKATLHVSDVLIKMIPELTNLVDKEVVEQGVSVYYYQEP